MITREERDAAVDLLHYRLVDVLNDWMTREKGNLDSFIANPQGHVDYSPYLVIDFAALGMRSGMLGQISNGLLMISEYKKENPEVTRSMHDYAVDRIPIIIWKRLYDWVAKRANDMEKFIGVAEGSPPVPLPDYAGAATFDVEKYMLELSMYQHGRDALHITIEFAKQEGLGSVTM